MAPLAVELPLDFKLRLQTGLQRHSEDSQAPNAEFIQSASISSNLVGDLGAFAEIAAIHVLFRRDPAQVFTNGGLTYEVTDDVRVDGGTRFGMTGDPSYVSSSSASQLADDTGCGTSGPVDKKSGSAIDGCNQLCALLIA